MAVSLLRRWSEFLTHSRVLCVRNSSDTGQTWPFTMLWCQFADCTWHISLLSRLKLHRGIKHFKYVIVRLLWGLFIGLFVTLTFSKCSSVFFPLTRRIYRKDPAQREYFFMLKTGKPNCFMMNITRKKRRISTRCKIDSVLQLE